MKQIVLWTFFVSFCLQPVARACNSAEAKTAAETHLAEKFALKDDSKLEVDLTSKPSRSRIGNPMNIQGRAEFSTSYYDSLSKDLGIAAVKKDLSGSRTRHLASYRIIESGSKKGIGLLSVDQDCKVSTIREIDLTKKN